MQKEELDNEYVISLIPSKAVRDYLTKLNWQFREREQEVLYRYLALKEEPKCYNDYVSIPHPFRSGDIVKEIGKEEFGIISCFKDDETFFNKLEEINKQCEWYDWSDTGCSRIDFLSKNGRFYHKYTSTIYFEYAEIPTTVAKDIPEAYYRSSIIIASNFVRGTENSIVDLQMVCTEYVKTMKQEV